jgi:hypothetical protein
LVIPNFVEMKEEFKSEIAEKKDKFDILSQNSMNMIISNK